MQLEVQITLNVDIRWTLINGTVSCSIVTKYFISGFFYVTAWKMSIFGVFLVHIFPHLDWIRRDTEYYVSFRIQSKSAKIRARKTPNTDTFHAVCFITFSSYPCIPRKPYIFVRTRLKKGLKKLYNPQYFWAPYLVNMQALDLKL